MIRSLCKDNKILSQKSVEATIDDLSHAYDLLDTINFHKDGCVGMALNMIGILKRIIICEIDNKYTIMINPKILKHSDSFYTIKEGCLCHEGQKEANRYHRLKLEYYDINFKIKIKSFEGFEAEIIQHEMDHLEGILI